MTEQAICKLAAIVALLMTGMSLKLNASAFAHYFGDREESRMDAFQFGEDNRCTSLIVPSGSGYSAEFIRK